MKVYKAEIPVYSYKNQSERLVAPPELYMKYKDRYDSDVITYDEGEIKQSAHRKVRRVQPTVQEFQKRAYMQKVAKIKFNDYTYDTDMNPFIFFYKFLAVKNSESLDFDNPKKSTSKHMRLKMWVPDTLVYNDGDAPFWMYSGVDGLVYRTQNFIDKHVLNKLGNQIKPEELVAIMKYPDYSDGKLTGNHFQLLNTVELNSSLQRITTMGTCAIQKFVKCKGPNPFLVRAVWRYDKPTNVWVITSRNSYYDDIQDNSKYVVSVDKLFSASIISSVGGIHCKETGFYLNNLTSFIHSHTNANFQELVADFLRDEGGILWFIGVRAFSLREKITPDLSHFRAQFGLESRSPSRKTPVRTRGQHLLTDGEEKFARIKFCKFCQIGYKTKEVCHKMTLKMIIQTQFYLKIEELRRTEQLFAQTLGIPIDEEGADDFNTGCGQMNTQRAIMDSSVVQPNALKKIMHPKWSMAHDQATEFTITNSEPIDATGEQLKKLDLYSILIIFHHLSDLNMSQFDLSKNYYLEYTMFDKPVKFKLNLSETKDTLAINKLRIYYFFSKEREGFVRFLSYVEKLEVRMFCQQIYVGSVKFELSDYKSELVTKREFNSVLSGTMPDNQDFTCFLKLTLGVSEGVPKNAQNITLRPYQGIYLPKQNYSTCEPLPDEWLELIPDNSSAFRSNVAGIKSSHGSISTSKLRWTASAGMYDSSKRTKLFSRGSKFTLKRSLRQQSQASGKSTKNMNRDFSDILKRMDSQEMHHGVGSASSRGNISKNDIDNFFSNVSFGGMAPPNRNYIQRRSIPSRIVGQRKTEALQLNSFLSSSVSKKNKSKQRLQKQTSAQDFIIKRKSSSKQKKRPKGDAEELLLNKKLREALGDSFSEFNSEKAGGIAQESAFTIEDDDDDSSVQIKDSQIATKLVFHQPYLHIEVNKISNFISDPAEIGDCFIEIEIFNHIYQVPASGVEDRHLLLAFSKDIRFANTFMLKTSDLEVRAGNSKSGDIFYCKVKLASLCEIKEKIGKFFMNRSPLTPKQDDSLPKNPFITLRIQLHE